MTQPRWRFARMTPAEINQYPVQGEFFRLDPDCPPSAPHPVSCGGATAPSGGPDTWT